MIQFVHVTKRYPGGRVGLDDVSFALPRGSFAFLTGASGAGKTTLLKLIYRELAPTSGRILVDGRDVAGLTAAEVPYLRRQIGVVFQDFRLIPRKSIFENVSYLPRVLGMGLMQRKRLAYETLRRVGLAHRMQALPADLSGGERQRVTVARALINRPTILLADEPTGNLDPELTWEILRLFVEINREGTTVLIATHEPKIIESLGGRVLVLDEGRLVYDRPLRPRAHARARPVAPVPAPAEAVENAF